MATVYRLKAMIPWEVTRDRSSDAWIGVCKPLKVTALGETKEDLEQSIFETIDALFRDLVSDGHLESFLRSHGWSFRGNPSLEMFDDESRFDIPIKVIPSNIVHAQA